MCGRWATARLPTPGEEVTLKEDLTISTPQGYNWIVQDDLQNTYDACKDGACTIKPEMLV